MVVIISTPNLQTLPNIVFFFKTSNSISTFLSIKIFLAIYSQIVPKIMKSHQIFRAKIPKNGWESQNNTNFYFFQNRWNCQNWMNILQINKCKAFSIQNINECRNMWLHHNTFSCQPSITSKTKKRILDLHPFYIQKRQNLDILTLLKACEFHIWNLGILSTQIWFQFVIGYFETFLVDGKFKGLSNKPPHARFWHYLQKLWRFFFFPSKWGHAISQCHSNWICPK